MATVPKAPKVIALYAGDPMDVTAYIWYKDELNVKTAEDLSLYSAFEAQWRPYIKSEFFVPLTVEIALPNTIVVTADGAATRTMFSKGDKGVFDVQALDSDNEPRTFFWAETTQQLDSTRP